MTSSEAASIPETIFGVVTSVHVVLPGSMRSGLKPRWKSRPATSPDPSSSSGRTFSWVVPG
jgi:hypothetical protein